MAEITRAMCDLIIKGFESKKGYPLTIWETAQLARAWIERDDARKLAAPHPAPAAPSDGIEGQSFGEDLRQLIYWAEGSYLSGDNAREAARRMRLRLEARESARESGLVGVTMDLTRINELAKVYATSYASPHHITFTVDGLRNLLAELAAGEAK